MKKLELKLIISKYPTDAEIKQKEYLEGIGVPVEEEPYKEELVNYTFKYDSIIEYRETFVTFRGEELPGVVCMYLHKDKAFGTPVMQISYQEFGKMIEENENN